MKTQEGMSDKGKLFNSFAFLCLFEEGLFWNFSIEGVLSIRKLIIQGAVQRVQRGFGLLWLGNIFNFLQNGLLLLLCLQGDLQSLDGELSFFCDWHVGSGWCETLSQLVRIVALHSHTNPRELHPDPSLVVVVSWWFLVQLKLLDNCLGIEVFQVFEVFRLWFFLFDVLDLCNKVVRFNFLFRLIIIFFLLVV